MRTDIKDAEVLMDDLCNYGCGVRDLQLRDSNSNTPFKATITYNSEPIFEVFEDKNGGYIEDLLTQTSRTDAEALKQSKALIDMPHIIGPYTVSEKYRANN